MEIMQRIDGQLLQIAHYDPKRAETVRKWSAIVGLVLYVPIFVGVLALCLDKYIIRFIPWH